MAGFGVTAEVDAASGKEELHSHRWRERRGEMDLAASPRRPPPREAIPHQDLAEKEDESGGGEGSSGSGLPVRTPPPGNNAEPGTGCRRQRRPVRGETGGNSIPAPERTDAIDPASQAGTRQPGGAGSRSEEHTSELQSLRHLVC